MSFLMQHQVFRESESARLFLRLGAAVWDSSEGRNSRLLKAKPAANPGKPLIETHVQAIAARAMNELIATGKSPDEAAETVSRAVKAGRCVGHEKISASRVKGWRDRLNAGPGGVPQTALDRYLADDPPNRLKTPQAKARFFLETLRRAQNLKPDF